MGSDNLVFLEVIEWFDNAGREMIHRIPESGSAEIKYGAQLTVRESQAAIFFYNGRGSDVFGPGRHTLKTANIPIISKLMAIPWGATSPLRAEVYFVNLKIFANLKWGTREPVAFRDSELGLVRLRAHGVYNIRIIQPALFINAMTGTMATIDDNNVGEYLRRVIVSRFNDFLGEELDSILNLPGRYDELSRGLAARLTADLSHFGLALDRLYITSITPPPEVQQTIDDQTRLNTIKDLDRLVKMKAANAMEKAAVNQGEAGGGMGMGMGLMMPAMFAGMMSGTGNKTGDNRGPSCPDCGNPVPDNAGFCPACGHQLIVHRQCDNCGKNLPVTARFCPRCGEATDKRPKEIKCRKCGTENLPGAVFCDQCGERIMNP